MTPHINAAADAFSETVLMPGDPLRAKFIAETYLDDPQQICDVRNMYGFTGHYQGQRISVMGHGMGAPSISIYAHELINVYNVKRLIRVGSCGGVANDIHMRDIIVATGASTESGMNRSRFSGYDFAAVPDFELLRRCWQSADRQGIAVRYGNVFTGDFFYDGAEELLPALQKMNILAIEMESAALFALAAQYRAQALSILTVSDHVVRREEISAEERQTSFNQMMELALDTATST